MPLARHDARFYNFVCLETVSTHMPLARHDCITELDLQSYDVSTHMPLARHDLGAAEIVYDVRSFYSHASCEA